MRIRSGGLLAALLLVAACGERGRAPGPAAGPEPAAASQAAAELDTLVEEYFEKQLELNPLFATSIGDHRFDHRLANTLSPEHIAKSAALEREYLERVLAIDAEQLGGQDRLSYETFRWSREMDIEGQRFPSQLQPINQFYSITNTFVQLGSGTSVHPFDTVDNYDDFLSRIDDFVVIVDQAITNMRQGMEQGIVQPRILMERVLPQLASQITDDVESSNFYAPIRKLPETFGEADRRRLSAAYEVAIAGQIIPAYRRLQDFIGDEYLSAARETVSLSELPDGEAWYDWLVRLRTTTTLSPAEIHRIGLDEVARIHAEMRGVMDTVGFEGDLAGFFDYLNTDDRFYFDEPEQLIQGYRDMGDDVAERAKRLFDIAPKAGFEVRAVEPFREKTSSGGSYRRGTPDGSRPGVFFANTYDIKARPKWAMESLFLHEAIPGHHFQLSIQQELEGVPRFRRFGGYTAFTEGWGLYAESLGRELGMYSDPYQYFGALNAELWRAIRLVVDTGIHSKGWSRQDVLDYMYANSAVKEARAVSEAERYMAIPGQALAYKIGQLKFRELRGLAEARLGERFDVRDFHTMLLSEGSMPLMMLEQKVERWIDEQAAL